ncbi:hypothetical protein PIB30_041954 [Stylosanthes scabra]|uniref:Uncharacterized protein n=1 Tax=Stylosanthes scabra TaxID=79078 RepID=A0ABU6TEQ7_9FABA|nr:hypothetical protein [Stylosanthes scabra]
MTIVARCFRSCIHHQHLRLRQNQPSSKQMKLLIRQLGVPKNKDIVFMTIALSLGSIYYDIGFGVGSIQARGYLITFLISLLSFMTLFGGFTPLLEEIKGLLFLEGSGTRDGMILL